MAAGIRQAPIRYCSVDEGVRKTARGTILAKVICNDMVRLSVEFHHSAAVRLDLLNERGALGNALHQEEFEAGEEVAYSRRVLIRIRDGDLSGRHLVGVAVVVEGKLSRGGGGEVGGKTRRGRRTRRMSPRTLLV